MCRRDSGWGSHQCRVGAEGCYDLSYAVTSNWAAEAKAAADAKEKEKKAAEAAAKAAPAQGPTAGDQKDGKESKDEKKEKKDDSTTSAAPVLNAAIGFSKGNNYEDFSFAMDVRDGGLYCSSDDYKNPAFKVSDPCQPGDVLGCGYNLETKEIFFTRNDKLLGVAFQNVPVSVYYAACGFRPSNQQTVTFNFGQEPFVFKPGSKKTAFEDAARPDLVLDAYRGPKRSDELFDSLVQPRPSDVAVTYKGIGPYAIINSSGPLIQADGKV